MTQIVAAELHEPLRDLRVIFRIRDSDRCPMRGSGVSGSSAASVFSVIQTGACEPMRRSSMAPLREVDRVMRSGGAHLRGGPHLSGPQHNRQIAFAIIHAFAGD